MTQRVINALSLSLALIPTLRPARTVVLRGASGKPDHTVPGAALPPRAVSLGHPPSALCHRLHAIGHLRVSWPAHAPAAIETRRHPMDQPAFQDLYPDELSHCYGCGRLNDHGLQLKSYWDGDETVAAFQPRPYHTALPGYVYGGLLASLVDCHATGTAAAAAARAAGKPLDGDPAFRFVTAALHVDYLRPTPLGPPLELRGQVRAISGRKVVVAVRLSAAGHLCVRGEVVAVQMPAHMAAAPPPA
jgi:acyl-coenzyme A thioesterase PaaI-like protein